MNWITKEILRLLCWKAVDIKANCMRCGDYKRCTNVSDIGFVCLECQARAKGEV